MSVNVDILWQGTDIKFASNLNIDTGSCVDGEIHWKTNHCWHNKASIQKNHALAEVHCFALSQLNENVEEGLCTFHLKVFRGNKAQFIAKDLEEC